MEPLEKGANQTLFYRDEHLSVDFQRREAMLDSQRITLTPKEYDLLTLLVQHAGEIVPREALLMHVWGYKAEIRTRTLDVHIGRLRRKLGVYANQYIETILGTGHRFQRLPAVAEQCGQAQPGCR